jgi:copper homeostasis protein
MVRPRPGGFAYSDAEFRVMCRDATSMLDHGATGIAFGILKPNASIDVERCREFLARLGPRQAVFHRAFDLTPDPLAALEQLVDLGVTRVMTSGQEASAYDGSATIARLRQAARKRIEVLPAGGITRFNLADVLARTGCDQIHAGLRTRMPDPSGAQRPGISFGAPVRISEDGFDAVDPERVKGLRHALDSLD